MTEALHRPDAPGDILSAIGSVQRQQRAVEVRRALLVLAWVDAHPGDGVADGGAAVLTWQHAEQSVPVRPTGCALGGERALQPAGIGTPLVAEFCLAELGAALGTSSHATRRLVGDLLELRHRLRACWRRFEDLEVPLWRLRRLAQLTVDLTPEAAAHVDRQVQRTIHTTGSATIEATVTAARWLHEPDQARDLLERAREQRDVTVRFGDGRSSLSAQVWATLDHVDAVDLEKAVAAGARALATAGSAEPLPVRRAQALGVLARGDVALALEPAEGREVVLLPRASREVVLHVHLSEAALAGSVFAPGRVGGAATIEQGPLRDAPVEAVRSWCGAPSTTRITVRPVLDPAAATGTEAYEPSRRLAELVLARDTGCVFPGCGRTARGCDVDHVVPYGLGGRTDSTNLAPLCRLHHRVKTHGGWRYVSLPSPGREWGGATYEWTSPHRQRFLVTTRVGQPPETRRLEQLGGVPSVAEPVRIEAVPRSAAAVARVRDGPIGTLSAAPPASCSPSDRLVGPPAPF